MNVSDHDDLTTAIKRLRGMAQRRMSGRVVSGTTACLDSRVSALAAVGAALALCSPSNTFRSLVDRAMAAGVTAEEVLGALIAVGPTIGAAGVVSTTPQLALALGYEMDAALEETENGTAL